MAANGSLAAIEVASKKAQPEKRWIFAHRDSFRSGDCFLVARLQPLAPSRNVDYFFTSST